MVLREVPKNRKLLEKDHSSNLDNPEYIIHEKYLHGNKLKFIYFGTTNKKKKIYLKINFVFNRQHGGKKI